MTYMYVKVVVVFASTSTIIKHHFLNFIHSYTMFMERHKTSFKDKEIKFKIQNYNCVIDERKYIRVWFYKWYFAIMYKDYYKP